LFTVFSFAYGLFSLSYFVYSQKDSADRKKAFARTLLGVAVTAVVMLAAGWPQLHNALFVQTTNRDKQIQQSMGAEQNTAGNDKDSVAERQKRYVFCTNWSLPPDEIIEFMIPGVKGESSDVRVTPKNQYHGRIGMQVAPGRWAPYRQHSLYMGFLTICFAFVGILGVIRRRKEDNSHSTGLPDNRFEIIFWTVSAIVLLFVALGGFTPFYRLVFMLPGGDYIRCPVKFVHLIEWCIAVLAGFGVAMILSSKLTRRFPAVVTAVLTVLLLINTFNLVHDDAKYCAVDPSDTIRIALAKETGSTSLGFVMDANAQLGENEYILAGGTAFRDNVTLKESLSKGVYVPESFWNFKNGRFVKTKRESAGFALLKSSKAMSQTDKGSCMPCVSALISMIASCVVLGVGFLKLVRR
jgi:hypothetical protein